MENEAGQRRKRPDEIRLQINLTPEIDRELGYVIAPHHRLKVNGRKVQKGTFALAILVHFLDLSEDQQAEIVAHGARRLDALIATEDDGKRWTKTPPASVIPPDDADPKTRTTRKKAKNAG